MLALNKATQKIQIREVEYTKAFNTPKILSANIS